MSCTLKHFIFNCSACPTGHQTQAPLHLIFSDVWGPSLMRGFFYFVIFMDAHTRFI